jgi:hypothetical protein
MSFESAESTASDAPIDTAVDDGVASTSVEETPDVSADLASQWDGALESADPAASSNTAPPQVDARGGGPSPAASGASPRPVQAELSPWTQQDFQYAQALGLTQQQLQQIGDPNVFRSMVNRVGQLMQQQAAPPQTPQTPAQQYQFQPYKLPGDESLYDDGIRGAIGHFNQHLQSVHQHYEQRFQQLAPVLAQFQQHLPRLAQMQQQAEDAATQAFYGEFDAALDALDESIFGKGTYKTLTDPTHQQARHKMAMAVENRLKVYRRAGEAPPPIGELAEEVYARLFKQEIQQRNAAVIRGRVADRMRQTTVAPSRTASRPASNGDGISHLLGAWDKTLASK